MKNKAFCYLFFCSLLFASCASISPITSERVSPAPFATIENVTPQWEPFVPGINYFHGRITDPLLEFWALQVDLASPYIRIVVRSGRHEYLAYEFEDSPVITRSQRVSSFVRNNDLVAGINALPFNVISAREGRLINSTGLVISDGVLISPPHHRLDALVFYTDGSAAIRNQAAIDSTENIKNAVGGFLRILENGEPVERVQNNLPRHPRSAAGISANGRYLYLLVIDGRRRGSIGSTEKETALLLRSLGSAEGINFDGGGSSSLVLRFNNGRIRPVNTPIHAGVHRLERAVAGSIGIKLVD